MLPAPTLADVLVHRERSPDSLCAVLFAPPFSKVATEGVIPRIGYLNAHSKQAIHFYCAGYGGYWTEAEVPDMTPLRAVRYDDGTVIPWAFSESVFASFVESLHEASTWRYSGETELILFNPSVSFADCIVFKVVRMLADGAIDSCGSLFEDLIEYSRKSYKSPIGFSEQKVPGLFGKAVIAALTEGPKGLKGVLQAGRHYATTSIAK